MELFQPDPQANLLPRDGIVNYHGCVLPAATAAHCLDLLLRTVPWKNDEVLMFGKRIVTSRQTAWFAESRHAYTYSGITRQPLPWTPALLELKSIAESRSGAPFNSCLLNLYHHGGEGMGWHSDNESSIQPHSAIASISLGAERKFAFKHRQQPALTASLMLHHGSLLIMKGPTQTHWLHQIPKTTKILTPRINLTFRLMREG